MRSGFVFPGRFGRALAVIVLSAVLAPAYATSAHHGHGLSIAPAGLVAAIAKTQAQEAAKDPALAIGHNGCAAVKAGPKGHALSGCFTKNGPAFLQGSQKIGLHLAVWGRAGHPQAVALKRSAPKANRIAYRGKHVREWWQVLPMGYEQGFTVDQAPKGHGEVVLRLQASRAPKLEHGTLAWGDLHYGKLHVIDASGKALPAQLSAHGKTITLAFDARHARYPVRIDPLVWLQGQTLTDPVGTYDEFGYSVALDSNGSIALVGARYTSSSAGTAYVYTESSGTWSKVATLTASGSGNLGWSVALDSAGSIALVGADGTNSSGAAYVFQEPVSGGWVNSSSPTATFTDPAGTANDNFGWSVALDSNGSTALVGADGTNSGAGAAYVFQEPASGGWVNNSSPTATLTASGSNTFGSSVALDSTGSTALVGADGTNTNAGAAYVYTESSSTWSKVATLTASGSGFFGQSVVLDSAGSTALVGADGTNSSGAAYVFQEPASGGWVNSSSPTATFTDPAGTANDNFGLSVALDSNGSTALVGADGTNSGAGAAYVFQEPASGGWVNNSSPTATLTASGSGLFGLSVALDSNGTTALVGAPYTNNSAGAALVSNSPSLSTVLNAPATVLPYGQLDSQYIVTNNSATASGDVTVRFPIPASNASLVGAQANGAAGLYACSLDSASQVVTCDLGSIPGGGSMASASLILQAGGTAGATIAQSASLGNNASGSPNLVQTASTSIVSSSTSSSSGSSGGGGAIGLWALLGLLGFVGAVRMTRRG